MFPVFMDIHCQLYLPKNVTKNSSVGPSFHRAEDAEAQISVIMQIDREHQTKT